MSYTEKKILIAYSGKYGTTERIAGILNVKLNGRARLTNIKRSGGHNLKAYDIIIIGSSIYRGKISKFLKNWLATNEEILLQKEIGLYLSCLETGDKANEQFLEAYPESLRNHAFVSGILGFEIILRKLNLFDRFFIGQIRNIKKTTTRLNTTEIDYFARQISKRLNH